MTHIRKIKKLAVIPLAAVMLSGGAMASYAALASAQTVGTTIQSGTMPQRAPHVGGTITAINGSIITVTADGNQGGTYTIDANNAAITKAGVKAALSNFAVGEKIWAEGAINGTSVVATKFSDRGSMGSGFGHKGDKGPGVRGTVSAVNGSTITVIDKDGKTYTVNVGSAKMHRMANDSRADIVVGDTVGIHGTVSGTSVSATTIMDGVPGPHAQQ